MEKIRNTNILENRITNNLVVGEYVTYQNGVNVIINDLKLNEIKKDNLGSLSKRSLDFLEPEIVFENLLALLPKELLNDQKIAIIYPANGGLLLKSILNINEYNKEYVVEAKRDVVNSMRIISLPKKLLDNLMNDKINTILVLDDVIVSGSTLKAIQDEVYKQTDIVDESMCNQGERFSWISGVKKRLDLKWFAGSLMTSARRTKDKREQDENLMGFEKVFTSIYYKGEGGFTPVNSISTWVYDENKGDGVLLSYANKYANNPDEFIKYVKSLNIKGDKL
jgi:hypothetical protein